MLRFLLAAIVVIPSAPPLPPGRLDSPVPVPIGRKHTDMVEHNGRWWVEQNGSWIVYHCGWLAYREGMFGGPPH